MNISWQETFKQITKIVAQRSTCIRLQVGAVLVRDNRIISIGYNGVVSGATHCCNLFNNYDLNSQEFLDLHGKFSSQNELHAEQNAIAAANKNALTICGCDMYISYAPCINCAKLLLAFGIKNVYYLEPYDRDMSGQEFLIKNNITCQQI